MADCFQNIIGAHSAWWRLSGPVGYIDWAWNTAYDVLNSSTTLEAILDRDSTKAFGAVVNPLQRSCHWEHHVHAYYFYLTEAVFDPGAFNATFSKFLGELVFGSYEVCRSHEPLINSEIGS